MTTYNSYEEAKIANPESDIYKLIGMGGFVFGDGLGDLIRISSLQTDAEKCNPSDHCMTIERFLADGHKFVDGDIALIHNGDVKTVVNPHLDWNTPNPNDNIRFILRATALEEKPSEKVEWVNGDECVFTDKNGDEKTCKVIGLYPPFVESYVLHCESANPTFFISNVGRMVKPETKQQREDRERLEAAYDLFCHVQIVNNRPDCGFESFELYERSNPLYTLMVDKTNYRISK